MSLLHHSPFVCVSSATFYFHKICHLYNNSQQVRVAPSSHSAVSTEGLLLILMMWYDFNLSKLPCRYFSVFSFFVITDKSSPCPHNNPIFSSACLTIPPLHYFILFFLVQFVMLSCHRHHYDCVSPWNNFFLLFYLNCSITTLLWVLSLQIWVNTNATRSVSACTMLWGRVQAAHHRKCLLERRVCIFSDCAACVLACLPSVFISKPVI